MADQDMVVVNSEEEEEPRRAVLLELEGLGLNGRQIVYDVLKNVLGSKNIDLTHAMFSKHFLGSHIKSFIPAILKAAKKKLSEDKLISEINGGIKLSFTDGSIKLSPGFKALVAAAEEKELTVGLMSCLDEETSNHIVDKLKLGHLKPNLFSKGCLDSPFPTVDTWMALCRKININPGACVAVATSAESCRGAIAASMSCVGVTDKFTSFQDFGGTDYLLDSLGAENVGDILELLEPRR